MLGSGDLYTANNHTIPEEKLTDVSLGGCFGTGPGIGYLISKSINKFNFKYSYFLQFRNFRERRAN